MIQIKRTDSGNQDFRELVRLLDIDLAERDGGEHAFYDQFNSIDALKYTLVLYENNEPIGCGAIKEIAFDRMEIKRMYTLPKSRGKGFASMILKELENWAAEMSFKKCVLETGKRQPEAIKLYTKNDYKVIPNYGQYIGVDNSICFEKELNQV